MSNCDLMPALKQAARIFSFAISDQMTGTVRQNCMGIVRRKEGPSFWPKIYMRCLYSLFR